MLFHFRRHLLFQSVLAVSAGTDGSKANAFCEVPMSASASLGVCIVSQPPFRYFGERSDLSSSVNASTASAVRKSSAVFLFGFFWRFLVAGERRR